MRNLSICLLLCIAWASPGWGNITVHPMIIRQSIDANQLSQIPLDIYNLHPTQTQTVQVKIMELVQFPNGGYDAFEPNDWDPNTSLWNAHRRSCRDWLGLPERLTQPVSIPPTGKLPVKMNIAAPSKAHGFYCATALVTPEASRAAQGLATTFEYAIPILVHINNRPGKIQLNVTNIRAAESDAPEKPGHIHLDLVNTGSTYHRLKMKLKVLAYHNNQWEAILPAIDMGTISTIPGSYLNLKAKLPQSLDKGCYQVISEIRIDQHPLMCQKHELELE